jgi:hypothetical protein
MKLVVGRFARRSTEKSIKAIEVVFIVVGNRWKPSCLSAGHGRVS